MRRIDSINFEEVGSHREGVLGRGPHQIRWAASGNPDGFPLIFSHGGPGGQNKSFYRTLFDLEKWYLVQIDQPGNGISTPAGETSENTTQLSIGDMGDPARAARHRSMGRRGRLLGVDAVDCLRRSSPRAHCWSLRLLHVARATARSRLLVRRGANGFSPSVTPR